jgi:hypothetical protein
MYYFAIAMQKEFVERGVSFKDLALGAAEVSSKDA